MSSRTIRSVFVAMLLMSTAACASLGARVPDADAYRLERLYFGRAIGDTGLVSDSAWTAFVRDVITPRFPAGITTWRAEGQWRSSSGAIVREPSVVLEVLHVSGENADLALGQVIAEYKRRFLQESVLWTSAPVRAKFQ